MDITSKRYAMILNKESLLPKPEAYCPISSDPCNKVLCPWTSLDNQKCLYNQHIDSKVTLSNISDMKDLNLKDVKQEIQTAKLRIKEVAEFHKVLEDLYLCPVIEYDLKYIVPTLNSLTRLYLVGKDNFTVNRFFFLPKKHKPWRIIGIDKSTFKRVKKKLEKNNVWN